MKRVLHISFITLLLLLLILLDVSLNLALSQTPTVGLAISGKMGLKINQGAVASNSTSAVLTYKYDNLRTGADTSETTLTPANVNVRQFGKRIIYPVDGQIYAQPLYVPGLTIQNQPRNVVFVATEHDSVYAFDANAQSPTAGLLWHTSLLPDDALTPTNEDLACNDTIPEMGITGTPVIDASTNTLYVVAFTKEHGQICVPSARARYYDRTG